MGYKGIKDFRNQFGFQKGKSTVDCTFTLHSIIALILDAGIQLYCLLIDYQKAFDKTDRSVLWQKLLKEIFSAKFGNALCSMYKVVKSCIRYQSCRSCVFNAHIGLKQGGPSSPLLLMMFINDIFQIINDDCDKIFICDQLRLFILLYADDAVLFAKSPDVLQSLLHDLEIYCLT